MKISKELISESEIQSKINKIGDQINEDYDGQDLLIIGILKGAFITISDLAKRLKVDVSFDFMSVSSYEGTETSGCLLYTSPSPRDRQKSRMPSSA